MASFLQRAKEAMQQPLGSGSAKDSVQLDQLLKDKEKLERDLQKAYCKFPPNGRSPDFIDDIVAVIEKSKDVAHFNQLTQEVQNLKSELEIMMDYQTQNAALKERIQELFQQNQAFQNNRSIAGLQNNNTGNTDSTVPSTDQHHPSQTDLSAQQMKEATSDEVERLRAQINDLQIQTSAMDQLKETNTRLLDEIATLRSTNDTPSQPESSQNNTPTQESSKQYLDQIRHLQESNTILEQQFKATLQSKEKEYRTLMETKERDFRLTLETREKDFKRVLDMKEKDIQASADKKYKSEKDQMKNTQKLVEEKEKQVRTLQQQNEEALMAFNKRMEELTEEHRGLRARITELESKCADAESQSQKSLAVSKALGDQLSSASSRCDILTAELEVSRAAQERASNALQEREETIKKLKQKYDEIVRQQQENKLALEQKQREIQNLQQAILDLQTQISQLNQERSDLKSTIVLTEQRVQEITAERDQIKLESDTSKRRTEEVETEFKALERRHALMMKDYQKQMQKQQQQQQQQQQQTVIQPVSVKQEEPKQQIPSVRSSTETTESKRLAEELKTTNEKLGRLSKELENKNKIIVQHAVRENSKVGEKPAPVKQESKVLGALMGTSGKGIMDPATLNEINIKLQSVITDLTLKNFELDEEVKGLKDLIRRQVNGNSSSGPLKK